MKVIEGLRCYYDETVNALGFLFEVDGESWGDQVPWNHEEPYRSAKLLLQMFLHESDKARGLSATASPSG